MSRAYNYGYENSVSVEDGINDTIDWYLENKDNKLDFRHNPFED